MAKKPSAAQLKRLAEAEAEGAFFTTGEDDPRQRAMRVDQAIRCCEVGQLEALELVDSVIGRFLRFGNIDPAGSKGEFLALVPATALAPAAIQRFAGAVTSGTEIVGLPAGAVAVGAVFLIGWTGMLSLAGNLGAHQLANAVLTLTSELRDKIRETITAKGTKQRGACWKCAMRHAFPQKPQKRRRIRNDRGEVFSVRVPVPRPPRPPEAGEVIGDPSTIPLPP